MASDADLVWKLIVCGDGGVGKTTILYRFIHDEFLNDAKMTIGVQFHTQKIDRDGRKVSLVLWDLGGQDRFRFMCSDYIRGAFGAFICFDLSNVGTLNSVADWSEMIRENAPGIPIVLVGTKLDLISQDDADMIYSDAGKIVREQGLAVFVPTSSKLGINVNETIYYMVDTLAYYASIS